MERRGLSLAKATRPSGPSRPIRPSSKGNPHCMGDSRIALGGVIDTPSPIRCPLCHCRGGRNPRTMAARKNDNR